MIGYGWSEFRTLYPRIGQLIQLIIFLPLIQEPFLGIPNFQFIPIRLSPCFKSLLLDSSILDPPSVYVFPSGQAKRVMFGRSIGATCAVHLAKSQTVLGLIVDSGLMSIKQLPTVQMPPGHMGHLSKAEGLEKVDDFGTSRILEKHQELLDSKSWRLILETPAALERPVDVQRH